MTLWPHQVRAVEETQAALARGVRRLAVTIPTGGGKTRVMEELVQAWLAEGHWVGLYSNRRFLIDQLSNDFFAAGIEHGIRASGEEEELERRMQILSIQTEHSRRKRGRLLHPARRIIVDEGHLHNNPTAAEILGGHLEDPGAAYVMFTATPLGMADCCDELIIAASMSDLRACGAVLPAIHYAPDEPDLRAFKKAAPGPLFKVKEADEAMAPKRIFGRVYDNFLKLNPERRPTILFAPGVPESLWYAERFCSQGIPWAHIDGEEVWINGEFKTSTRESRAEILEASRTGRVVGVSTRFVLREGINLPWIGHCIFATIFGGMQTYLQSGGRALRNHVSLDRGYVTIQDHGGNWWRHGSLNEDRHWELAYTAAAATGIREDRLRKRMDAEPFRCPGCGRIWAAGRRCNPERGGCGLEFPRQHSRPVLTVEGTLKEMHGDIYQPRRVNTAPNAVARWIRMYWRSRTVKGAKTFAAAMALYAYENNWQWPDESWPLMPVEERDNYRLVADVPMNELTSVPEAARPKELHYGQEA